MAPTLQPRPGFVGLRVAAAALLVLVLAGCAGPRDDTAPSALPDGVTAELVQLRSDVAARQAQVEVHNGTDETVEIGAVTVTDPRFADVAERQFPGRTTVVDPGATVDIRIQLPPMQCDATGGASTVQLMLLERGFDDLREGELPDPLDVLGPLHERECRAQALADAAAVSLAEFAPSQPDAPADLVLEVAPTGDGKARIVGIHTTNLLTFGATPADAVELYPIDVDIEPGDTEATEVALPLLPFRCDPHAVQEDKRGTIFTLDIEVDGVPGEIELAASEDMRGKILTWVGTWCGFGG